MVCFARNWAHNTIWYIIFLKWLDFQIIVICSKLRAKLQHYGFLCFFGTFAHKVANLVCFARNLAYNTIWYIFVLKWLELKFIVICSKLHAKLQFYRFLSFFGTCAHKVTQTWFVLHETWHTTLFGIYYSLEVVKIENHSYILEITCYVAILRVFKLF